MDSGRSASGGRIDDLERNVTPAPRKEIAEVSSKEPEWDNRSEEMECGPRFPPLEKLVSVIYSLKKVHFIKKVESGRSHSSRNRVFKENFDHLIEGMQESPRDDISTTYEFHWKEARYSVVY